jgi:hypothetical protein
MLQRHEMKVGFDSRMFLLATEPSTMMVRIQSTPSFQVEHCPEKNFAVLNNKVRGRFNL